MSQSGLKKRLARLTFNFRRSAGLVKVAPPKARAVVRPSTPITASTHLSQDRTGSRLIDQLAASWDQHLPQFLSVSSTSLAKSEEASARVAMLEERLALAESQIDKLAAAMDRIVSQSRAEEGQATPRAAKRRAGK